MNWEAIKKANAEQHRLRIDTVNKPEVKQALRMLRDAGIWKLFDMIREAPRTDNIFEFGYVDPDGCWENEGDVNLN